ncbi:ATP-dependent helicase [Spirochaetia bacterium]|nr:ATP-dependent helicase [Spirochaetia bacterium]
MDSQFSRLAPFIREYIYEKKWIALRDIQEAAIRETFDSDGHILIAAGTASGKTEACFFPIISLLCENRPSSVGALYIGPLKALINDQAERLAPLMELAELQLWRWHGDVSDHHKKNLLENPSGVLQITPESLEALLLRSPAMIHSLFQDLSFVIIDEVHAFMGSERGSQILCQLARIEEAAGCRPRRIGLSATLGDYHEAMAWLGRGSDTALIREGKTRRRVSIALDYFSGGRAEERACYEALYQQVRGRRCIVFTNSRIETEFTIAALGEISAQHRGGDRFFVHHGSISASLRAETERELRQTSAAPVTAAATATLEMGIDIGKLDRVIQIGPPLSVSAFVQRLGRSGRLRGKPEIYFSSIEESGKWEHPVNSLPWDLIKTIAIIELYLTEKWIEQGEENSFPYSLLVHQTISILCSLGAHSPASLARRVLSLPAFSHISEDDFKELLAHLASLDVIEKTGEGEIIAGLEAERLTAHYSFYSVFADSAEYRVISGGREIGRINFIPPAGSSIVLGGRYWRVEWIAQREREIMVSPGEAGSRQVWRGSGADLHKRVAAYMRKVLAENTVYPYLSERARSRLAGARELARQWQLATEIFISAELPAGPEAAAPASAMPHTGPNAARAEAATPRAETAAAQQEAAETVQSQAEPRLFILLPWLGGRGMRTLLLILQNRDYRKALGIRSLSRENDLSVNIRSILPIFRFRAELAEILKRHDSIESLYPLLDPAQIPLMGKFDPYLPSHLLVRQYAVMLDRVSIDTPPPASYYKP